MTEQLDLTVITVSWNSRDELPVCLQSVSDSARSLAFEHIVVDNGSTDGSPELVERDFPHAIVIRNGENLGFSRANNVAARTSRGRYVLFLNADTEVLGDALPRMVAEMDRQAGIGILGPKLLDADRRWSRDMGDRLPTLWSLANTYLWPIAGLPARGIVRNRDFDRFEDCGWVCGAALMVRREVLERHLWHEGIFFFGEDIEYSDRVRRGGFRVCATPDARVIHYSGKSMSKQSVAFLSGKTSGIALYLRERKGPLTMWAGVRIIWLGFRLRALRGRLSHLLGLPGSRQKDLRLQQYMHLDRADIVEKGD
jgi:GT2 family glycosyltransferase